MSKGPRGFIEVDGRGRTSLARVRSQLHDRYLVEELPDGTLILTPATLVSVAETHPLSVSEQRRQAVRVA